MKDLQPETVSRMKCLLVFVVLEYPDPPVSQHTITVHQEELDARGAPLYV
jgi:hypothetical protein